MSDCNSKQIKNPRKWRHDLGAAQVTHIILNEISELELFNAGIWTLGDRQRKLLDKSQVKPNLRIRYYLDANRFSFELDRWRMNFANFGIDLFIQIEAANGKW